MTCRSKGFKWGTVTVEDGFVSASGDVPKYVRTIVDYLNDSGYAKRNPEFELSHFFRGE